MSAWKRAHERIRGWRENPAKFAHEELKLDLDPWQVEALEPCGGTPNPRRRVGMKACTGPGKSLILGVIGWHRLSCFGEPGEHPKGAALSGEGRENLRDNLWAELAKLQQRSEFLMRAFTLNQSRIYANDHQDTWFLSARGYPKDADEQAIGTSLSGLHSRYPFLLLDEIGNMPPAVGQKASQIFTGGVVDGLIAAAGNPTSLAGLLYKIATIEAHLWNLITITADPDDPKRTPRVDIQHAREQIEMFGRENPWIMATILGNFPPSSINSLLGVDEVEAAMNRHVSADKFDFAQKRLGIDVARSLTGDRTVLFPRQGLVAFSPVIMRGARSNEIAGRALAARAKWEHELDFVDASGGYGSGVIDALIQAGQSPQEVFASGAAIESKRYYNMRAETWWKMAEWVKRGGCLPRVREMIAELTVPTYTHKDGKLLIEPKDLVKKRLGRSPDLADALGLTFSLPEMPKAVAQAQNYSATGQAARAESDWDPYANA